MSSTPGVGTILAGRYRLVHPLGQGAMGSVWKAEHLALSSHVAVKIIAPQVAKTPLGLTRFLREARSLAALRSPYIVQVLDFGSDDEIAYLVMELLEGRSLERRLKVEGNLSPTETSRVLSQVCIAMGHTHERGLIHRDLKPDNIFLCDESQGHITKVVDFGIAKSICTELDATTDTRTGSWLGTPSYMSPEQCLGAKDIDQRSDLWAIGCIAYECLVGERPFDGAGVGALVLRICSDPPPVPSERGRVPSGFDVWFQKAVAKDPSERFQSAGEMAQGLREICGGEPDIVVDSSPPTVSSRSGVSRTHESFAPTELAEFARESVRTGSRSRVGWELALVAGLAAVVAVAIIFVVTRSNQAESSNANAAQPDELAERLPATQALRARPTAEPAAEINAETRGPEPVKPVGAVSPAAAPQVNSVPGGDGRASQRRKAELPSTPSALPRPEAVPVAPDVDPESAAEPSIEEPRKAR